jgi:hypothetical protein
MTIRRVDEQTISIGPLDLFSTELLHQIRNSANPADSAEAKRRLYPSPTNGVDPEYDEEWIDYTSSELAELFASSIEVIEGDLADFPPALPAADHHTLLLPIKHLEAWIHGLNQARLALSARYHFTEKEMDGALPMGGDMKDLALVQVHFYAGLQECFLRILRDEE